MYEGIFKSHMIEGILQVNSEEETAQDGKMKIQFQKDLVNM